MSWTALKLAHIIRLLTKNKKVKLLTIHTGQHYDYNMNQIFFEELAIPTPNFNLGINNLSHGNMVGNMMIQLENIFLEENPNIVIVQGDTNSTLAGALIASKLNIKVAHIEAGLRSFDTSMPEEVNRKVIDHISNFCFVPSKIQKRNLLKEGIDKSKIYKVGNTIVDEIYNIEKGKNNSIRIEKNFIYQSYIYLSFHRQENTKSKEVVKNILSSIK